MGEWVHLEVPAVCAGCGVTIIVGPAWETTYGTYHGPECTAPCRDEQRRQRAKERSRERKERRAGLRRELAEKRRRACEEAKRRARARGRG